MKLRFDTNRGAVTTEDLWDIPLTCSTNFSLDNIAKGLSREISNHEESFVTKESSVSTALELKFNIVKHVIAVKLEERELAKKDAERKELKQKIMAAMEEKQDASLRNKSLASLQKMLDEL